MCVNRMEEIDESDNRINERNSLGLSGYNIKWVFNRLGCFWFVKNFVFKKLSILHKKCLCEQTS